MVLSRLSQLRSGRARSHSLLVAGLVALGSALPAKPALAAPTARECASASEDAIALRKDGKLTTAKDRLLVCADAACPAEIREDCARRVTDVSEAVPSVVFELKDPAGNDVAGLRVLMDGVILVERLGGASVQVDPGEHTFRFEGALPGEAVEKRFVIREGERNRHLAVTIAFASTSGAARSSTAPAAATAIPGPTYTTSTPAHHSTLGGRKTWALVAGGVGIVGIGVGAAFGLSAISSWNSAKSECGAGCYSFSPAQATKSTASSQATVSTVGFIAGGVLVAGAAVLWFTAPSGAQVQVGPTASADGAGLSIRGTF